MYPVTDIFGRHVSTYAIFVLLGCAAAAAIFMIHTRKTSNIGGFDGVMLLACTLIGALAGSKLLYIIVEAKDIFSSRDGLLGAISGGGFVFYGGLIGVIGATALYCRRSGIAISAFFDSFTAPMCLGHALGRVGCFFAGCCYGCETNLPIGVMYPENGIAPTGVPLLPTQLMEACFLIILFAVLLDLSKKRARGFLSSIYLISYGAWRFIIEFFRRDDRGSILSLSTSQFISIFLILIGILWLLRLRCRTQKSA